MSSTVQMFVKINCDRQHPRSGNQKSSITFRHRSKCFDLMAAGTEKSRESIQNLQQILFQRSVSARGLHQDGDGTRCRTGFRLAHVENKWRGVCKNVTNHETNQSIGHYRSIMKATSPNMSFFLPRVFLDDFIATFFASSHLRSW